MIVKWLNGLVAFLLILVVFANKEHFVIKAERPVGDLAVRESVSVPYIKNADAGDESKENVNPANENPVEPESAQEDKTFYVFPIQPGMGSKEVSKLLYELGVTESEMAFSFYLMENGYAKNLQIGAYEITREMSFKEMAQLITSE